VGRSNAIPGTIPAMLYIRYRPSRGIIFALLMLLSGLSLVLPARLTGGLKHMVQFLVPVEDLASSIGHHAAESMRNLDKSSKGESILKTEAGILQSASQAALVHQLQQENDHLRNLRRDHVDTQTPLLPARVVSQDMAQWRDSILIARGSSRNVSPKDWALSHLIVSQGVVNDVLVDQAVLCREGLLGRVDQVSPYMSRVQLFSDVDSPRVEVRIAHVSGTTSQFIDYPCSVKGLGLGRMVIEGVSHRYVNTSQSEQPSEILISTGDLVYSAPGQIGLPRPMLLGKIITMEENARKRLVYDLSVEPVAKADDLHEVYIVPLVPIENMSIPQ
jgi:cell shape-determining protein MreC